MTSYLTDFNVSVIRMHKSDSFVKLQDHALALILKPVDDEGRSIRFAAGAVNKVSSPLKRGRFELLLRAAAPSVCWRRPLSSLSLAVVGFILFLSLHTTGLGMRDSFW